MIKLFNFLLEDLKLVLILDVVFSLLEGLGARRDCRYAFYYKKSKTKVKKDLKERTNAQKIFGIYNMEQCKVPHYLKMFYGIRIFEPVYSAIIVLLYSSGNSETVSRLVLILVLFRFLFISIPYDIFFFYCNIIYRNPKDIKGWGYIER